MSGLLVVLLMIGLLYLFISSLMPTPTEAALRFEMRHARMAKAPEPPLAIETGMRRLGRAVRRWRTA